MIVAVFNNDDYARGLGLTQWDYGQELRIQGLNLPTAVEIHFALRETGGEAVTRVGVTQDGITTVPIPDSMLEGEGAVCDYHIYAWIYLSDTKSGETIKRIDMPVKARSKPEPFETPEDVEIFREAIEAVNEAADRAEKAGAEAVKVGEEAKEAAAKAGEHLEAVQSLAGQVEINADAVAQDKQAVAGMVTQTQHAASEAALSEQAAKQSQTAAEQAQAGAEAAEDTARQYAAETEEDRQEVAEDKQTVSQMRDDVAADREAVENAVEGFDGAVQGAMGEIANAGKTQVAAVNTAGQTAVQAVETAKGEAVKVVEAEGTEQAGIVAAEGAKQLGEIARVMATIPEDYTALSELAESNYRTKAPGIVETAAGAMIEIKDGSDLPVQRLTVHGRSTQLTTIGAQLFNANDAFSRENKNGVSLSVEKNEIVINGVTTGQTDFFASQDFLAMLKSLSGDFTFSIEKNANVALYLNSVDKLYQTDSNGKVTVSLTPGIKIAYFIIRLSPNATFNNYRPKIMLNSGSSAIPWEPYTGGKPSPSIEYKQEINTAGEGGEIGLRVCGSNLLNITDAENGMMRVSNLGSEILVETLGDVEHIYAHLDYSFTLEPGTYTLKADSFSDHSFTQRGNRIQLNKTEGNVLLASLLENATSRTFTIKEKEKVKLIIYNGYIGAGKSYKIKGLRLNVAKEQPFEPYKSQSITLPTPTGLPGISVTSGGNYTDSDGQQWVCDTMEYDANGQSNYVQRVNKLTDSDLTLAKVVSGDAVNQYIYSVFEYDTESYIARDIPVLCNKFIYGKKGEINTVDYRTLKDAGWGGKSRMTFNVEKSITKELFETEILPTLDIIVPIPNPIRTPLSTEQVAVLKQLHTFHPTTIITNDAGVDVSVDYVADTKTYIDNQFAQLNKTILDAVIGGK